MGVYSEAAKQAFLESDSIYNKHTEDYYKSRMFYGYAQVLIDAKSDSEARYFAARAINDFDIFKTAYKQKEDMKLNGIVLRPVGEANDFVACYTDPDTKSRLFETVRIIDGKVESCTSKETSAKVVTEGAKEILKAIGKAIKDFLEKIIGIIKKLLGMKPNDKQEKDLKDTLDKAEKAKSEADNINDPEEAKDLKKEADEINKKTEDIQKEMEDVAKGYQKAAEYTKNAEEEIKDSSEKTKESMDYGWADINKRMQQSMENMNKSFDNISDSIDNIRKNGSKESNEFLDDLADILAGRSSKGRRAREKSEPIDVEYKEVEKESYNLARDFGSSEVVLSEGAKEILGKIWTAIKNFIKGIIDTIKKLLGKKPNEKQEKDLKEDLNTAEEILKDAEDLKSQEDPDKVVQFRQRSKDVSDKVKNTASEMKKNGNLDEDDIMNLAKDMNVKLQFGDEEINVNDPDFHKKFNDLMDSDKPLKF